MGKKSKRNRGVSKSSSSHHHHHLNNAQASRTKRDTNILDDVDQAESRRNVPPSMRIEEEETPDNLRFQDPYIDEFEEEEEDEELEKVKDDDDAMDEDVTGEEEGTKKKPSKNDAGVLRDDPTGVVESWNPLTGTPLEPGQKLEMDETAYKMHHALTAEWPSLSFDFIRDDLGDNRTRFPHSIICAVGTQADRPDRNKLTVMKLCDLARTSGTDKDDKDLDDEMLGEEYNPDADSDEESDDDDDDEEEEEEVDLDPILEHYSLRHHGGVNRIRTMPQRPEVVATWSDTGTVNLYNVGGILDTFARSLGVSGGGASNRKMSKDPFFVYSGHGAEGYAMDWSRVNPGHFATGDCNGNIHLWTPACDVSSVSSSKAGISSQWTNSSFTVKPAYSAHGDNVDNPSVEDIQWSPTEGTVLASAECGGYVRVYDTRAPHRAMISNKIHENGADVNVLAWNALVGNLLATGGDDGAFSVWDLRTFQTSPGTSPKPLARFTAHRTPITSLEWHPTDESMIAVTDEDGTYIYDLSIEEDEPNDGGGTKQISYGDGAIPPQLLFVHCGSESTKEAHWHPQVTSLVMTTALSGFSIFIPSNL